MTLVGLVDRLPHLARRFVGYMLAKPLSPKEQRWVGSRIEDRLAELFWEQSYQDQRHAHDVARSVDRRLVDHTEAVKAALLHDVGKRHSPAGALGRSAATVLEVMRLPLPRSWRLYRAHGEIGAADLAAGGAGDLIVAFARDHPGACPEAVDPKVWKALLAADDA